MKRSVQLFLIFTLCHTWVFGQHVAKSILHDNETRQYLEYVPPVYDGSTAVPLVFCLHGLADNMNNFSDIAMNLVADTANFIVITPQAMGSFFGNAWNSGAGISGVEPNPTVDDVGFIEALIDTTMAQYNIDYRRIYVMGFSKGGFMSNRLACELNNRIAAIAPIAGTIGSMLNCTPHRAVPVCHFHGTNDNVVGYYNNSYGMSVPQYIDFWVANNMCDTVPIVSHIPDTFQDGFTADHYEYRHGDDNSVVELFKINNAGHIWLYQPQNNICYTRESWRFLSQHKLPLWLSSHNETKTLDKRVYPNPFNNYIFFEGFADTDYTIKLYDNLGKTLLNTSHKPALPLNLSGLKQGLYFLQIFKGSDDLPLTYRIVKN